MGKWEVVNNVAPPGKEHVHDLPDIPLLDSPGLGSVWRCRCQRTWKVYKIGGGESVPSYALAKWNYDGDTYYLSPFNYDQASPFPPAWFC